MEKFKNRKEAGEKLGNLIAKKYYGEKNIIVLAIPRGGVVIGYEIAKKINSELDIIIPRKIGAPQNPEFALGAIGFDGKFFLNPEIDETTLNRDYLEKEIKKQREEIERKLKIYRGEKPLPEIQNKIVILTDDGIATGSTMLAAVNSLKGKPKKIVICIPVLPIEVYKRFQKIVDDIVCLFTPEIFFAVGQFYEDFSQTTDEEVIKLLKESEKN
jgi:predicted phosphoribosyltransferase